MEPLLLTATWMLPLLAIIVIAVLPREKEAAIRTTASVATFLAMLDSIYLYFMFDRTTTGFQFRHQVAWLPDFGINYIVGVDGLNMPMVLLTGLLGFTVALVSYNVTKRIKEYYMLTLASIAGVFGLFASIDLFFLVLFYELASVPIYFLVGSWGSEKQGKGRRVSLKYAATKLILYLQLGGALVLLSAIVLYLMTPSPHTFDFSRILAVFEAQRPDAQTQILLFPLIFIAFGIEAGLWPFHTWLPDGHSSAPTALSMLLAGVLLKMGGYGIIRLGFQLLPDGATYWMPLFAVLGLINVLYGAFCALNQSDIKYLIAYSSVSHMGMVTLGLAAMNATGLSGAVFQMFSHGVITALLFAMAGYVYEKTHTRDTDEHGGLAARMPFLSVLFSIGALASLGLPGMSGFAAEFLVFFGIWKQNTVIALLAICALVYTATYLLRAVQKIFLGPLNPHHAHVPDAIGVEKVPITVLAATTIAFGMWPALMLDVTGPTLLNILQVYPR